MSWWESASVTCGIIAPHWHFIYFLKEEAPLPHAEKKRYSTSVIINLVSLKMCCFQYHLTRQLATVHWLLFPAALCGPCAPGALSLVVHHRAALSRSGAVIMSCSSSSFWGDLPQGALTTGRTEEAQRNYCHAAERAWSRPS